MRNTGMIFGVFSVVALAGCGGSLNPNDDASGGSGGFGGSSRGGAGGTTGGGGTTGAGGSTPTGPCASLSGCDCLAASDRCTPRSEACWCPTECNGNVCVCGGGQFLACENKAGSCASELAAVQTKCAGQSFIQFIGEICSGQNATCVAGCLANLKNTGSCSEIDCGFCTVCDCAAPAMPSPFATCLANCSGLD